MQIFVRFQKIRSINFYTKFLICFMVALKSNFMYMESLVSLTVNETNVLSFHLQYRLKNCLITKKLSMISTVFMSDARWQLQC